MAAWLSASQYLQKAAVDHLLGVNSTAMPSVFLALFTSDPGETGSLAGEVSGGSYGRQAVSAKMTAFAASGNNYLSQLNALVQFPVPTAAWGTVTHVAFIDAVTLATGNVLWYGELEVPLIINVGSSPVTFTPAQLQILIAGTNITQFAAEAIGDHFLGKTAYTTPTACDFHLFQANPTSAGSFADEADYGDYVAVELTSKMAAASLSGANAGIAFNDTQVDFAAPSSGSNTLPYVGISDGEGSPSLLFFTPLRHAMLVNSGDPAPSFKINTIAVQLT